MRVTSVAVQARHRAAALMLLLALSVIGAGCGLATAGPTPVPALLPTASPTPLPMPRLLLLGVAAETPLRASLETWAAERGWLTDSFEANEAGLAAGLSQPGVQAIVSLGETPDLRSAFAGPVLVVNGVESAADSHVSVAGEPGARHDQAGFLAGVLAGLISRTERVAILTGTGGPHEAVYSAAFDHGLRYGCPRCELVRFGAAQATAQALLGEGVDAVFAVPGPTAASTLRSLADADVWMVWCDADGSARPGTRLAGEIRMLPEALAAPALTALLAGEPGRGWPYSVESNSMVLGNLNPEALSPGRERVLQEAREGLASGQLQIGVDPLTGVEP